MKSVKKSLVYLAVLSFMFVVVGCTSNNDTSSTSEPPTSQVSAGDTTTERPDWAPDLEGKVKQVRGNEITVLKVIRTAPELTEEEKAKRREQMQSLSPEERAKIQAEMFKITDETLDLTIPVGVPVVSNQNVGGKIETENVSLADIRQSNMLKFWFAEGSSDEIIYVQLSKSGQ